MTTNKNGPVLLVSDFAAIRVTDIQSALPWTINWLIAGDQLEDCSGEAVSNHLCDDIGQASFCRIFCVLPEGSSLKTLVDKNYGGESCKVLVSYKCLGIQESTGPHVWQI